jgi:NTP pyrophosphatase (non-canonical NTP hydrolase)
MDEKWDIDTYINVCHGIAKQRGWWDEDRNDGEMIALMHSELSEALEALREDRSCKTVAEELADCLIRIFDFCGGRDIDLEGALQRKIESNKTRPYRHGKKF